MIRAVPVDGDGACAGGFGALLQLIATERHAVVITATRLYLRGACLGEML